MTEVTTWGQCFPSKFLKAESLTDRPRTFTILGIRTEELEDRRGQKETRGVIAFAETQIEMVLNRTKMRSLIAMFPEALTDPRKLIGHKITVGPGKDLLRGEDCVTILGSPELKRTIEITVDLRRKRAKVRLEKTT